MNIVFRRSAALAACCFPALASAAVVETGALSASRAALVAPALPSFAAASLPQSALPAAPAPTLAEHLDFLLAQPGALSAAVSEKSWEIGKPVTVVFADLESLRAAREAAAGHLEYWSRLLPKNETMADALGLPHDAPTQVLVEGYARQLAAVEGVRRVLTGSYERGGIYFDAMFDDRATADAVHARLGTPSHQIPVQAIGREILKGLPPHPVTFEVEEGARRAHLDRLEASYAESLAKIPGVLAVERETRPGGMGNPPTVVFTPVFESHEALGRARDAELLPDSFPTVPEYLWEVDYYAVQPRALKAPQRRAYLAAARATARKGGEYSSDDYALARETARAELASAGAKAAELALFDRLCDEAPVRGGRFKTLFDR